MVLTGFLVAIAEAVAIVSAHQLDMIRRLDLTRLERL